MFAVWAADKFAPKLGDPNKRLDDLKLPNWLSIFHVYCSNRNINVIFLWCDNGNTRRAVFKRIDKINFPAKISISYIYNF